MIGWLDNWGVFSVLLFLLNFILSIFIVFFERRRPAAALAWICMLFAFPVVGFIFYVFLAQNLSRMRLFKLSTNEEYFARKALKNQINDMADGEFAYNEEGYIWRDMIKLNQTHAGAYYTQDNDLSIYPDGNEFMGALFEDIRNAEKCINVQFFILKYDEVGKKFLKALEEKAREGVEVRLLLDAVGSRNICESRLKDFAAAGGKYSFFFRTKLRVINLRLNYRNHRKMVTIDNEIGYIGGYNIAREYVGKKRKFGYWRDTHLRFKGGCVRDINSRFLLDWREASKEQIRLENIAYPIHESEGNIGVQIVSSGPESDKQEIKRAFMKMITSARDNIYIQSPYLVPDQSILESLKIAAQSGVDVKIMIPCMPDHMFVYWATYSYAAEIIREGGRVFVYDKGFLHAKTMMIDGQVFTCGSSNFDQRSFSLSFEANAFVYDSEATKRMEEIFIEDLHSCHELTMRLYESRSLIIKIKEAIARLMSDLL